MLCACKQQSKNFGPKPKVKLCFYGSASFANNSYKMITSQLRRSLYSNTSKSPVKFFSRNFTVPVNNSPKQEVPLKGYRKYAQQFKSKPGSYMTTFAILHEVTAVLPFPFIYLALDASSVKIPFPDSVVAEGNRFINKARVYYGYDPLESDSRVMMNLVTTYCIVKVNVKT
jgi:hypothetical protein